MQFAIADLIAQADHIQWASERYCGELADWVRPNGALEADGIPGYAMGFGEEAPGRSPDMSTIAAKKDYKLAIVAPALAILGTKGDTPSDWIAAGRALARILLWATAEGVSSSFFNQLIEIVEMRTKLAQAIGTEGFPQIVLRMGYGTEVRPTPRRPVSEVSTDYQVPNS
jgi:hypothetical protein